MCLFELASFLNLLLEHVDHHFLDLFGLLLNKILRHHLRRVLGQASIDQIDRRQSGLELVAPALSESPVRNLFTLMVDS